MDPPGCPEPAKVVIFSISPLASLESSESLLRELLHQVFQLQIFFYSFLPPNNIENSINPLNPFFMKDGRGGIIIIIEIEFIASVFYA